MENSSSVPSYNQPILQMLAQTSIGLRAAWLTCLLAVSSCSLRAANPDPTPATSPEDATRQFAHKIAAATGPGFFTLQIINRSSLDEKTVKGVSHLLATELLLGGVQASEIQADKSQTNKAQQSAGAIAVVLSESLREYVWTAEITAGPRESEEKKVVIIALPRPAKTIAESSAPPPMIVLKATRLFEQEQRMLDVAIVEMPGGPRLFVLSDSTLRIYRQTSNPLSHWELETSLPVVHSRFVPRDLRGRLLPRHDYLLDVYLPGTVCHSTSAPSTPLALVCNPSDAPWPLASPSPDSTESAAYVPSRNFFIGALSPGIGRITTVPSFYSAAAVPQSGYVLWAFAAVDGTLHLVNGSTDQLVRGAKWGSDITAIRSACGPGTLLIASISGTSGHDSLRAFEVPAHEFPDNDPVAVSSAIDSDGRVVALSPDSNSESAIAIVKRNNTGWYEAYRISASCAN